MSLKEYLVKRDMRNYRVAHGLEDELMPDSKKRKFEEIDVDAEPCEEGKKKINCGKSSFLDVGSLSWSMLLACFFLQLHDDRKSFHLSLDGVKEML